MRANVTQDRTLLLLRVNSTMQQRFKDTRRHSSRVVISIWKMTNIARSRVQIPPRPGFCRKNVKTNMIDKVVKRLPLIGVKLKSNRNIRGVVFVQKAERTHWKWKYSRWPREREREKEKERENDAKIIPAAKRGGSLFWKLPKLGKAETRRTSLGVQLQPSFVPKASLGKEGFWMNQGSLSCGMPCFNGHWIRSNP